MYIVIELSFGSCCLFLLVVCFAVSPGTWPGGAWVPGGPCPGFSLLLLFHDPNFAFRNFHQDVSRFRMQKELRPNSRIMHRFFTSHQLIMNEQDQVTWTNWPARQKKSFLALTKQPQKDTSTSVPFFSCLALTNNPSTSVLFQAFCLSRLYASER